MFSSKACVVPKWFSTCFIAVGASFSQIRAFSGLTQPRPLGACVPKDAPESDLNAQVQGHRWPRLLTSSHPDDGVSQELSSCEAVSPGQPLLAVVTEWEHAVLSLLAPLLGPRSMCYNNKSRNPDPTRPYLKIWNESIGSKCIQSGNRAQSHTWTELLTVTLKHRSFCSLNPDLTHFGRKATARRWEKQIMFTRPACSPWHT